MLGLRALAHDSLATTGCRHAVRHALALCNGAFRFRLGRTSDCRPIGALIARNRASAFGTGRLISVVCIPRNTNILRATRAFRDDGLAYPGERSHNRLETTAMRFKPVLAMVRHGGASSGWLLSGRQLCHACDGRKRSWVVQATASNH